MNEHPGLGTTCPCAYQFSVLSIQETQQRGFQIELCVSDTESEAQVEAGDWRAPGQPEICKTLSQKTRQARRERPRGWAGLSSESLPGDWRWTPREFSSRDDKGEGAFVAEPLWPQRCRVGNHRLGHPFQEIYLVFLLPFNNRGWELLSGKCKWESRQKIQWLHQGRSWSQGSSKVMERIPWELWSRRMGFEWL